MSDQKLMLLTEDNRVKSLYNLRINILKYFYHKKTNSITMKINIEKIFS